MPQKTKLPDSFLFVTDDREGPVWVNLASTAAIYTILVASGTRWARAFKIEMLNGRCFNVTEETEVKALAAVLGYVPRKKA